MLCCIFLQIGARGEEDLQLMKRKNNLERIKGIQTDNQSLMKSRS